MDFKDKMGLDKWLKFNRNKIKKTIDRLRFEMFGLEFIVCLFVVLLKFFGKIQWEKISIRKKSIIYIIFSDGRLYF